MLPLEIKVIKKREEQAPPLRSVSWGYISLVEAYIVRPHPLAFPSGEGGTTQGVTDEESSGGDVYRLLYGSFKVSPISNCKHRMHPRSPHQFRYAQQLPRWGSLKKSELSIIIKPSPAGEGGSRRLTDEELICASDTSSVAIATASPTGEALG